MPERRRQGHKIGVEKALWDDRSLSVHDANIGRMKKVVGADFAVGRDQLLGRSERLERPHGKADLPGMLNVKYRAR